MPPFTAFLDANVLYPAELRSFLMFLAVPGIFRARWSDDVHEEWISNLLERRPDLTRAQLERTRQLMDKHAPDALVTGYRQLVPALTLPDPNDRHVLVRLWVSSVSSPDLTISLLSGPKISSNSFSSLLCSAVNSALLASSGDENVLWPACCAIERLGKHPAKRIASVASRERRVQ